MESAALVFDKELPKITKDVNIELAHTLGYIGDCSVDSLIWSLTTILLFEISANSLCVTIILSKEPFMIRSIT